MSSLTTELAARGLLVQISDAEGLDRHLNEAARTVYAGVDPTAESLHIGNLVPLLALRRFQRHGHRPVVVIGGATGLIGDPSGKQNERSLLNLATVSEWAEAIKSQVSRFVDLSGNGPALIVNNLDWTRKLDALSFLRDVGKHFSVNVMIRRDTIKSRLERDGYGISFTEFSYMLLQAYDFLELLRRYNCTVQIGGSDQWGNMISGVDLIRRLEAKEAFAATMPLVEKSDGTKFGKTAEGTIWLDPSLTSPYTFYQFWMNTTDEDVPRFLRLFTFVGAEELARIDQEIERRPADRSGQKLLAQEVTKLVHGNDALRSAERITNALFSGDILGLELGDLVQLQLDGLECVKIKGNQSVVTEVVARSGLASSRSSARQLIAGKGLSLNGVLVDSLDVLLNRTNALYGRFHLLRRGKKSWVLVVHEKEQ